MCALWDALTRQHSRWRGRSCPPKGSGGVLLFLDEYNLRFACRSNAPPPRMHLRMILEEVFPPLDQEPPVRWYLPLANLALMPSIVGIGRLRRKDSARRVDRASVLALAGGRWWWSADKRRTGRFE